MTHFWRDNDVVKVGFTVPISAPPPPILRK
jgi:hypothetical protein